MPSAAAIVKTKSTTVDNVSWTALTAPIDCNSVMVLNAGTVVLKLRTTDTDASTQISINPGQQFLYSGPFTPSHSTNNRFRFLTGDTVMFAQLASSSYALPQSYY